MLAIANAIPGDDTITFDPSLDGGTIRLSLGEMAITDSVGIEALGSDITIDAGGHSRIFDVDDGHSGTAATAINVNIVGLTLTGGSAADGGAIYSTESLSLQFVNVTDSTASDKGGGIYALTPGATVLQSCTVSGNNAANDGGGIYASTSYGTSVQSCTISGNTAGTAGGGIYSLINDDGLGTTIQGCTISGNTAGTAGGGIYLRSSDNGLGITIQSSTISDDVASDGAGLYSLGNGQTVIQYSTISGNIARGGGGGLSVGTSLGMQLQYSTVSGNYAVEGGGILTVTNSGGNTLIQDSTIAANRAFASGGGLYLANTGGTATIQNSTITGNIADYDANGEGKGGGIFSANDPVELQSTIIARNTDRSLTAPDVFGPVSLSYCLVGDNTGSGLTEAPVCGSGRQWQPDRRSNLRNH